LRAQRSPGYYGVSQTQTFSEASGVGGDYLAEVCRDWEAEALRSPTRTVIIRTGGVPCFGAGQSRARQYPAAQESCCVSGTATAAKSSGRHGLLWPASPLFVPGKTLPPCRAAGEPRSGPCIACAGRTVCGAAHVSQCVATLVAVNNACMEKGGAQCT